MQTQNRAAPHLVLAIFTLANFAALFLSANAAPPVARQQLRLAAANTQAASSFVAILTETVASNAAGATPTSKTLTFLVQEPDRVQESGLNTKGQDVTGLAIGERLYVRTGSAPWQVLNGSGSTAYGTLAAQSLKNVLQGLVTATTTDKRGANYYFVPGGEDQFVYAMLNTQQAQLTPGSTVISATIGDEFVSRIEVSAQTGSQILSSSIAFSEVGHAPALQAPVVP